MPANEIEAIYVEIGRLIQTRRNRIGMTQEILGSKLTPKVTRASIANIESGKQRVLTHTLLQLADTLNIEVSDLLPKTKRPSASAVHVEAELAEKLKLPKREIRKLAAQLKTSKDEEST